MVALGLWPKPPEHPLKPTIHGKIDRDDYTIEKVFFESLPGHCVSGNLYRPKRPPVADAPGSPGKFAGILMPHGHHANGRFNEAGEGETGGRGLEHRDHSRLDQGRMAGQISQRRSPPGADEARSQSWNSDPSPLRGGDTSE